MRKSSILNSLLFITSISIASIGCVKFEGPANESKVSETANTDKETKNGNAKSFSKGIYLNLMARKEIDFKGVLSGYPNFESVTIRTGGGFSKYSRAELEKSNYLVKEFAPGHGGKYLILVTEANGVRVSQFMAEL